MFDLGIVVPVRRGSSRIREKCALPFAEQNTLIEWKLKQLAEVIEPKRIFLSSEDDAFLSIARELGASAHKRASHLAVGHTAEFREVITGIVEDIPHEHIAWCTVVCPLMAPRDYSGAFRNYHAQVIKGDCDSLLGVVPERAYFWSASGPLNYKASRDHTISQDLPEWFKVTNSVYMAPRDLILRREYFLGERPYLEHLPKLASIDIDYIDDYRFAQALHAIYEEDGLHTMSEGDRIHWGSHALA